MANNSIQSSTDDHTVVRLFEIETSKILAEREEFLLKYSKVRMIAEPWILI